MKRFAGALIMGLVLAAGSLGPSAHAAAPVSFTDPEGDATGFVATDPGPLPSEDGLDVTKATLASDGKVFTYTVQLKKVQESGAPTGATGHYFRLYFTYGGTAFMFRVADDANTGKTTTLVATDDDLQTTLECKSCLGTLDRKTSQVVLKAPITSLSSAVKKGNAALKPIVAGSVFTDLHLEAQRSIAIPIVITFTPGADVAAAPETTKFTF